MKAPPPLRALAKGQRVGPPAAGRQCSVAISDKVFLSLRIKEAKIARERFPLALNAFFESLGQPSQYAVVSSAMGAPKPAALLDFADPRPPKIAVARFLIE